MQFDIRLYVDILADSVSDSRKMTDKETHQVPLAKIKGYSGGHVGASGWGTGNMGVKNDLHTSL